MVLIQPWYPQDQYPSYPDPYPLEFPPYEPSPTTIINPTITVEKIKEVEKKWKEKHIKNVKKGILITFEGDEQPLFIATDDECWTKIMDAVKDEPRKKSK